MTHLVAPSLLSANFAYLEKDIKMLNNSEADWLHLDIMDGVFVPNISFGMPVIRAIRALTTKPLDTHLMIVDPHRYVKTFADLGVDWLTIHFEATDDPTGTLEQIRAAGMKAGISIKPDTEVNTIREFLPLVDMVLIMSVFPGFGGQKFIEEAYDRIRSVKDMIKEAGADVLIEVDGGVGTGNAKALVNAGTDVLVAGNSIFKSNNPVETIHDLKQI